MLREAAEETLLRESQQRRFLYRDVETLLEVGHLHHTILLRDVPVTFRSMDSRDVERIVACGAHGSVGLWKRWRIAQSVWMIGGFSVHGSENASYYVYNEWVKDLHFEYINILSAVVIALKERLNRCLRITPAFAAETYSRSLWRMMGRPVFPQGNIVQQVWSAHNLSEDQTQADTMQWEHTRAISGSMSGKVAKSLRKSGDTWKERRKAHAQRLIEDAVNWVISGAREDQKPLTVTLGGKTYEIPKIHSVQTVAEMEEEMDRAMKGEKDYHDTIVDGYKAAQKARIKKAQDDERAERARRGRGGKPGVTGSTVMTGYTPDQLAEFRPDLAVRQPNVRKEGNREKAGADRYFTAKVSTGWIGLSGNPEAAKPAPSPSTSEPTGGTLQEKVARRKPKFKS